MKKKRLLIFHQSLAPYRIDFWNSLNELYDLKLYFAFDNVLIQTFDQEALKARLNFEVHYLTKGFNLFKRAFRWGLLPIIKEVKPDIIISQEFSQTTMSLYLLKRIFKFNYTLYTITEDSLPIAIACKGIRKAFRRFLVPRLTGLVFVDNRAMNWYDAKFGLRNKSLLFPIIHNDAVFRSHLEVALPLSNELMDKYGLTGKRCIFYVGRLAIEKGLSRLLTAFGNIHQPFPDARLILIGEGDQRKPLTMQAEKLQISGKVLLPGRTEGNELYAWFNLAPVKVLASQYEPFGAVVNELLLSGADVLCSTSAGAWWLISPGVNGDIFEPYDIETLSRLLTEQLHTMQPFEKMTAIKPSKMRVHYDDYITQLHQKLNEDLQWLNP